jgi:hypothetical protein
MKNSIWTWALAASLVTFAMLVMSRSMSSKPLASQPVFTALDELECEPAMNINQGGTCSGCTGTLWGSIQAGTCGSQGCQFNFNIVINCGHSTIGAGGGTIECGDHFDLRFPCPTTELGWKGISFQCIGDCPE